MPENVGRLLRPFAEAPGLGAIRLRARATFTGRTLGLTYVVDPAGAVLVPDPDSQARRRDGLWRHTCFEAFVGATGAPAYWEINLSPSGSWNVYRFAGYRDGMRPEERIAARVIVRRPAGDGALQVDARCDLGPVPELAAADLEIALSAVLEARDGSLSYWALHHHGVQPDFHARAGFVLAVPRARDDA